MKTTVQILEDGRALIEDEAHWTPGCPRYGQAEYCIVTALQAAGGWAAVAPILKPFLGGKSVIQYNANHNHKAILALFDRAIEAATS